MIGKQLRIIIMCYVKDIIIKKALKPIYSSGQKRLPRTIRTVCIIYASLRLDTNCNSPFSNIIMTQFSKASVVGQTPLKTVPWTV